MAPEATLEEKSTETPAAPTEEVKSDETLSTEGQPTEEVETEEETLTALGTQGKPKEGDNEELETKIVYEDFNLPEGVELDEARLEKAVPVFQELELDQGKAQKVIDFYSEMQSADAKQAKQDFLDLQKDWLGQLDNHPDFGGDNKAETLEMANKVVGRFGGDELRQVLDDTGMGNHWALIMAFARVGRLMTEDQLVTGGSKANHSKPKTDGQIFYPDQDKK